MARISTHHITGCCVKIDISKIKISALRVLTIDPLLQWLNSVQILHRKWVWVRQLLFCVSIIFSAVIIRGDQGTLCPGRRLRLAIISVLRIWLFILCPAARDEWFRWIPHKPKDARSRRHRPYISSARSPIELPMPMNLREVWSCVITQSINQLS